MPVPAGSRELLQKAQKGAVGGRRQNSIRVCTFLGDKAHLSFLRAPNAPCVSPPNRNDVGDWNSLARLAPPQGSALGCVPGSCLLNGSALKY